MTDFNHHYKDREPQETVKIIENFFNKRGFKLDLCLSGKTNANTYFCMYALNYNGKQILTANGKGMDEMYCKASCFAEMYERFCAYTYITVYNPIILNDLMNLNYKKFGYYLHPNEKELSFEDILNEPHSKTIFSLEVPEISKEYWDKYADLYYNKKCYGVPFKATDNPDDIKYISPKMLGAFVTTTGLAAGNTFEEAIVQAISEFYERIAIQLYYKNNCKEYYYLNIENLDPQLKDRIHTIEQVENVNIQIYDLSYSFNMPVCMLVAQDKINHIFHINFGASPIINIAIERCITEIYQGVQRLPLDKRTIMLPGNIDWGQACLDQFHSAHLHENIILPEALILYGQPVEFYNKEIFLNNDTTNKELLQHINKINQLNNIHFRWADYSLTPEMKAVSVISDTITLNACLDRYNVIQNLTFEVKEKIFESIYIISKYIQLVIRQQPLTNEQVQKILETLLIDLLPYYTEDIDIEASFHLFADYLNIDFYNIYCCRLPEKPENYLLLCHLILNELNKIKQNKDATLHPLFQAYDFLNHYLHNNYSKDDLKKIYEFLGFNIDIDNINTEELNMIFIIKKLYFDYLYEILNSDEYKQFISALQRTS